MNQFTDVREPIETEVDEEAPLNDYYRAAQTWSADRDQSLASSRKTAWMVAAALGIVALLEAVAIVIMLPLKTVRPYTLLVDRQTGYVQALDPIEGEAIKPSEAMANSFLAQYVIAREGFDIDTLKDDYRKVALWSGGDARTRYVAESQASNPTSKLATLPRTARVEVEIRSISSVDADTAMVRYSTYRVDSGGTRQAPQSWASIVSYRFSGQTMSAEDRLVNPLGFQVMRYRRNAEFLGEQNTAAPSPVTGARVDPMVTIQRPGEEEFEDYEVDRQQ
ncbi:MAG: virB8 family protein [Qipengyuania vulgaris]